MSDKLEPLAVSAIEGARLREWVQKQAGQQIGWCQVGQRTN